MASREPETFEVRAQRLQRQLLSDLEHTYFGGVAVMRDLTLRTGAAPRAQLTVVFTSVLSHGSEKGPHGSTRWFGRQVKRVAQTSQVWLDDVVREEDGELVMNWNFVTDLFPDGFMAEMLDTYQRLLQRLAHEPAAWQESLRTRRVG